MKKSFIFLLTGLSFLSLFSEDYTYMNVEDTYSYMKNMTAVYPDIAKVYEIGETEGENNSGKLYNNKILAIKISSNPDVNELDKTEIVIQGGMHGREWLGVATTLYMAQHLLLSYDTNPRIKEIINSTELWFISILNPDGYQYCYDDMNGSGRFWRKNRKKVYDNNMGTKYYGVDLNRNFDANWGCPGTMASSLDYCGTAPFSEKESQALRNLVFNEYFLDSMNLTDNVQGLLNYHSYSQKILYSYSSLDKDPANVETLKQVAQKMSNLMKKEYGKVYEVVRSSASYVSKGDSLDWFFMENNEEYLTFTIELPPKPDEPSNVNVGFIYNDKNKIEQVVTENFSAMLYFIEAIATQNLSVNTDQNNNGITDYLETGPVTVDPLPDGGYVEPDEEPVYDADTTDLDNISADDENPVFDTDASDSDSVIIENDKENSDADETLTEDKTPVQDENVVADNDLDEEKDSDEPFIENDETVIGKEDIDKISQNEADKISDENDEEFEDKASEKSKDSSSCGCSLI